MAAAIDRFHNYQRARDAEDDRQRAQDYLWVRGTAFFAFIAAIATAFAAVFSGIGMNAANRSAKQSRRQANYAMEANQMTAESGRAWIAPTELRITQPISVDKGIKAKLVYTNPGREPAINVLTTGNFNVLKTDASKQIVDSMFPDLTESVCSFGQGGGGTVAFPTTAKLPCHQY